VRTLKTSEAAELLNVSANTLRSWEERFGYPRPERSPGGHRLYRYAEIEALRRALHDGLSAASATSKASETLTSDVRALVSALLSFSRASADSVVEASLALKPIERAIEDLLLASLDELLRRSGRSSAAWAFASSWGCDWLRRTQRVVEPPECNMTVLVVDATQIDEPDAPHVRALEFFCAQRGAEILSVSATASDGLTEAVTSVCPHAIVVAGNRGDRDMIARWVYTVSRSIGARPLATYRRPAPHRAEPSGLRLDDCPSRAQRQLFALVHPQLRPMAGTPARNGREQSWELNGAAHPGVNGVCANGASSDLLRELAALHGGSF
jgi:DNA-binding transcriptional MerR regulator